MHNQSSRSSTYMSFVGCGNFSIYRACAFLFFMYLMSVSCFLQVMVMLVIPNLVNESTTVAGSFKDMFRLVILIQNIPRFVRFFLLIAGCSPTSFVFETAWANFTLNLFLYVLVGHVVGSCWYLFSVQVPITIQKSF
jgi:cyclic nucleotide gated channel